MKDRDDQRYTTELFSDKDSAEKGYRDALDRGYKSEEITVLMSQESRKKYYDSELVKMDVGDKSMEGLAIGGATGGVIAGTLGAIAAIGTSLALPGLGLVIAGPLAVGLAGAGAGSIAGGFIGALIGWGIPEERAKIYEKGIKNGGIVLGVPENTKYSRDVQKDWEQYRSRDVL